MVKSYDDPTKRKARDKLREFISKNSTKPIKDVKVVCFPGAEIEGEEALEVKEIYDALGIPRENIVGLEYAPESAERLKKADLGIEVICQDAYDFFKTTDRTFDVVSLDYTGQRTWKERDITRYVGGRGVLNKFGIFCTNHLIRREGEHMKKFLLEQRLDVAFADYMGRLNIGKMSKNDLLQLNKFLREEEHKHREQLETGEIDLNIIRDAIILDNLQILTNGKTEVDPSWYLLKNNPAVNNPTLMDESELTPAIERLPKKGIESGEFYLDEKMKKEASERGLLQALTRKGFPEQEASSIMRVLRIDYQKGSTIGSLERYIYTSNKNGRMLYDMMALKPISYSLVQGAKEIISIRESTGQVNLNPLGHSGRKLRKRIEKIVPKILDGLSIDIPHPTDLGSSWVPPKRKEKVSKDDAIDLLKGGYSPAEISECYSGFTKMQLAAFKAHYVTMRKDVK